MEFKRKVHKRQKAQRVKNQAEAGKVRVKIRGRKRWISPVSKKKSESTSE